MLATLGAGAKLWDMDAKSLALTVLGKTFQSRGYRFVAVTPATHYRVLDHPPLATTLESILGWNRPFERGALDPEIFDLIKRCRGFGSKSGSPSREYVSQRSTDLIFAHSAFPRPTRMRFFSDRIPIDLSAYCGRPSPM